jgi:hypothetical protein
MNTTYKISFDGKTIEELPADQKLFSYIKSRINGAKEVIKGTFTTFDLQSGDSKKLIVHCGRKSVSVFAGKNLKASDLVAKYDGFGSLIN